MRPINRIDPIIDALREAWHANPDLCLAQLIIFASVIVSTTEEPLKKHDAFYTEDDLILKGIKSLTSKENK